MDFKLSSEQQSLRKSIREFAEMEIAPIAFQLDERKMFPKEIIKKMGENGWLGIPYSKEYGGLGKDILSYAMAVEEFSRIDGGVGVILSAHVSLGTWPIATFGTEEQKRKYLIPMAKGEKLGAFGLTEENAGSDASGTETTAVPDGDFYILNGKKEFITNAPEADVYVIFAVTEPGKGSHGISAFLVEKGWEGFTFGTHYNKMGIRSSATAQLVFNNVKVPKENLLGELGAGFKIAMMTLEGGRIGIAAQALGIAQGAYEQTVARAKERVQFGKPIGQQQAIGFKIADMATKIRAARFMVYSAAELKQNHESYGVESAMAKQYASDVCLEVVNDAVQIFGGSGYIKGITVERMYRDAKITTIYEGTNEIQRMIISSAILGKAKKDDKTNENKEVKPAIRKITGERKNILINSGSAQDKIDQLLDYLKSDGFTKSKPVDINGPISEASRICAFGMGVKHQKDVEMVRSLAESFSAVLSCSRPVAEEREWMDLSRYVGISGQKFKGDYYIGVGISGQIQHLLGIKDARTIIAINWDEKAPFFANADYSIIGDLYEIVPLLIEALSK